MSTQPQTEEYLAARRESCRLLGLNADDLTPHEMIRADLATVLRLWLDGSQSALLAGGSADPVKLLSVVEALTKLVPETEHKSACRRCCEASCQGCPCRASGAAGAAEVFSNEGPTGRGRKEGTGDGSSTGGCYREGTAE